MLPTWKPTNPASILLYFPASGCFCQSHVMLALTVAPVSGSEGSAVIRITIGVGQIVGPPKSCVEDVSIRDLQRPARHSRALAIMSSNVVMINARKEGRGPCGASVCASFHSAFLRCLGDQRGCSGPRNCDPRAPKGVCQLASTYWVRLRPSGDTVSVLWQVGRPYAYGVSLRSRPILRVMGVQGPSQPRTKGGEGSVPADWGHAECVRRRAAMRGRIWAPCAPRGT